MVFRYITDKVLLILPLMKPLDQVEYVLLYIHVAYCTESTRQEANLWVYLNERWGALQFQFVCSLTSAKSAVSTRLLKKWIGHFANVAEQV